MVRNIRLSTSRAFKLTPISPWKSKPSQRQYGQMNATVSYPDMKVQSASRTLKVRRRLTAAARLQTRCLALPSLLPFRTVDSQAGLAYVFASASRWTRTRTRTGPSTRMTTGFMDTKVCLSPVAVSCWGDGWTLKTPVVEDHSSSGMCDKSIRLIRLWCYLMGTGDLRADVVSHLGELHSE